MSLHTRDSGAAQGVDVAGLRIRRDLHRDVEAVRRQGRHGVGGLRDGCDGPDGDPAFDRAGGDPRRERVVETDRGGLAEHVDALLQALVRLRERREIDAQLIGQDLMAQAHRQQGSAAEQTAGDDAAHRFHAGAVVARVPRTGARDHEVGGIHVRVGRLGPVHDPGVEPQVAELVREHRGEAVLGIHDQSGAPGEGSRTVGVLRVHPERGEPVVAGCQELRDRGILGERATRGDRCVGVGVGRGDRVARDRADRAEHTGGLAVRLADLAVRVGVAHQRRPDGHPQASVDEVRRANEDGGVEVVGHARRGTVGREQGRDAGVVAARGRLVAGDHGAGVLHGRTGHRGREHRLAQDVARVERAAPAQHVLGVRQPRHLLQVRPGDASAVAADGAHHLQLLVDDHEELLGLFGRAEELGEGLGRRAALRVTERARDRVHRHDAVAGAHVRLGAGADGDMARGHDREGPVRALLVLEQGPEPRQRGHARVGLDSGDEVATDDEVRPLAAPDLVRDHPAHDVGVGLIVDVETGAVEGHGGRGKGCQDLGAGERRSLVDHEAAQRCAVVVADEAALADLPERHEGQNLAGRAVAVDQWDVGEEVDVDDGAREHFDGRVIARDERERRVAGEQVVDQGGGVGPGHRSTSV